LYKLKYGVPAALDSCTLSDIGFGFSTLSLFRFILLAAGVYSTEGADIWREICLDRLRFHTMSMFSSFLRLDAGSSVLRLGTSAEQQTDLSRPSACRILRKSDLISTFRIDNVGSLLLISMPHGGEDRPLQIGPRQIMPLNRQRRARGYA
jgi:hypothetical protein